MKQPASKTPLRERAACASCEFGDIHKSNDRLRYCRRKAPTVINSSGSGLFPVVSERDWCGDYREDPDV